MSESIPSTSTPVTTSTDVEPASTILVNSVVAAVLGSGLMVFVHELAHLVAGLILGERGRFYPFGVDFGTDNTPMFDAITAGAAPVFSLVTGLIMALWTPLRRVGGFAHLLWLWFAFASIMEFVGYIVITPFGAGDTAQVARALGWGEPVQFAVMALGIGLMFVAARLFAPHVGWHAGAPDGGSHAKAMAFAFWPWLIGTVINMAVSTLYTSVAQMGMTLGDRIVIALAGSATLVFAPMAFIFNRVWSSQTYAPLGLRAIPVAGLVAFAVLTAFNVIALRGL